VYSAKAFLASDGSEFEETRILIRVFDDDPTLLQTGQPTGTLSGSNGTQRGESAVAEAQTRSDLELRARWIVQRH
jgi:hypothetical protein